MVKGIKGTTELASSLIQVFSDLHVTDQVNCHLKILFPPERQPLMFSYSTLFDIHGFICGDIFHPNSPFCVPTQVLQ